MLKRFGTEYGGFYYPENLPHLDEKSIVYCVGVGEDISHDIEVAKKLGCDVYLFDPTPRAIDHVNYIKNILEGKDEIINNKNYGGGDINYLQDILKNKVDSKKIIFEPIGLFTENKKLKFYKPSNPNYVSCSVVEGMKGDDFIMVDVECLKTIMKRYGHTKIDMLKIDIEGCECEVIEDMIKNEIMPIYLSVDFDSGWHGEKIQDKEKCMRTIQKLIDNGYKIIFQNNSDFSFIKLT